MQRDPCAFLWDIREAALAIQALTVGMDAAAFANNELVQAAAERKFAVMGEALNQLARLDASLAARMPDRGACEGIARFGCAHRERCPVAALVLMRP